MKLLSVFFIFAISSTMSMEIRPKRQASQSSPGQDSTDGSLQVPDQLPCYTTVVKLQIPKINPVKVQLLSPDNNGISDDAREQQIQQCINNCRVTTEYNPVCGTDRVQYTNPGRLECAQECGVNVSLLMASPCPTATTTTTTVAPN